MIYLDNAATSWPKPPMVVRAMAGTLQKLGGNPGRSGHALSLLSSCICLALFQTERFSWYFKPFSAMQMILLYTLAAFAFHLFLLRRRP